ncbi:DUF4249 domain-containing protein [Cryomorpha ignava]|uniref:DUF4249 domain-containing protein n=1 Tax=Cryomorpha ignava TaxID=101383 RepID=A0A7K3WUN3_9FLAO|nr:DUF4249 domain-containing protein [Cryomorpha ignava]NEN25214.1 DUF4249 domain-containing protein [Cryomorpha ignava]
MNRFYQIIILFSIGFALTSCEDKIDLDLPDGETFLVVEGWITNEDIPQTVKLTYTSPYFEDAAPPVVTGANVLLRDSEGNENELLEFQPGVYQFDEAGIIGRSYQLYIILPEGDIYESAFELLREPVPIDSIYWQLSDKEPNLDDDENPDDIYDVLINTYEPEGLGDHYQWRSFLNGVEAREPFDIFTTSDQLVDGGPIPQFNVTEKLYSTPDTVVIVQERISKAAYEFLTLLQNQTAFVGSPFDTPPVPIEGNVRNLSDPKRIALGFFGAAGRDRATVIVGE